MSEIEQNRIGYELEINSLRQENAALRKELAESKDETRVVKDVLESQKGMKSELEGYIHSKNEHIVQLEDENANLKKQIARLEKSCQDSYGVD